VSPFDLRNRLSWFNLLLISFSVAWPYRVRFQALNAEACAFHYFFILIDLMFRLLIRSFQETQSSFLSCLSLSYWRIFWDNHWSTSGVLKVFSLSESIRLSTFQSTLPFSYFCGESCLAVIFTFWCFWMTENLSFCLSQQPWPVVCSSLCSLFDFVVLLRLLRLFFKALHIFSISKSKSF